MKGLSIVFGKSPAGKTIKTCCVCAVAVAEATGWPSLAVQGWTTRVESESARCKCGRTFYGPEQETAAVTMVAYRDGHDPVADVAGGEVAP